MTRALGWLSARDSDLPHGQLALNSSVLNLIISFSFRKKNVCTFMAPLSVVHLCHMPIGYRKGPKQIVSLVLS